jgi:hypothetical protein
MKLRVAFGKAKFVVFVAMEGMPCQERRKSVGLGPLKPYLKQLEEVYLVPQTAEPKETDKNP